MIKEETLEDRLNEAKDLSEREQEILFKSFKERDNLLEEVRKIFKNNQKPDKELLKKYKKIDKTIRGTQENLRYLGDRQAFLEDEIEFSKY